MDIKEYRKQYYQKNKEKFREYSRNYFKRNKALVSERRKDYASVKFFHVKQYGLSKEDYLELLKLQDNKCKLCGIEVKLLKGKLHVDHDHKTGKVRGLLCRACNHGLGNFKDSIELLHKAVQYLS